MEEYIRALEKVDVDQLHGVAVGIYNTLKNGGRVFIAGNGGSHTIAQHFASDLVWGADHPAGRPKKASVICLGCNHALLTALANDHSYDSVFSFEAMQHGLCCEDLLVTISVSGTSQNIVNVEAMVWPTHKTPVVRITANQEHVMDGATDIFVETGLTITSPEHYYIAESVFSCMCHEIARFYHQYTETEHG